MLRNLAGVSKIPWCILGDFNDLMYLHEKRGGRRHPEVLLEGFRTAVNDCHLCDLGFLGSEFTWKRSRGTTTWIQERLDRGLANME